MINILAVDDEVENLNLIKQYGEIMNYNVDICTDPLKVTNLLELKTYQIVVLDVMMPELNGFELLEKISQAYDIKVIFLSARSSLNDRLKGLELGAIDYIAKPFSLEELFLKIANLCKNEERHEYTYDGLTINIKDNTVKWDDESIQLSNYLFDLLYELLKNSNKPLSRTYLLDKIWSIDEEYSSRTVDTHIHKLRLLLKNKGCRIVTVRSKGYLRLWL